ncbi:hypothetical protein [Methylorubrum zatmanii]|uniref:Uncharacterized protein n=1 Tax=Methylorubrum zatmanii TaxID=29429 RepID=A0ABW1WXC8_9HYPH|nr:hypothetical protein [Methylorubrum zatmanii]
MIAKVGPVMLDDPTRSPRLPEVLREVSREPGKGLPASIDQQATDQAADGDPDPERVVPLTGSVRPPPLHRRFLCRGSDRQSTSGDV